MAVFRVERTRNYTIMSNYHLRDKRISLKAKGLLSQMLSLPEDWDYTLSGLARINAEGKDAIRAAVVELEQAGPLEVKVSVWDGAQRRPCPYPELLLVSALNPEAGSARGTSLLRGLPFVSEILLKIYHTLGVNWDRLGNVRFAVTCKPDPSGLYAGERARQMAQEWQRAMRSSQVSDFVAVGDVSIQAIGADNQILDSEVPVRQMLEQIVAKLGVPPFLLGLSWSSTERMSSQQADMLTSELDAYRRVLTPVIRKICRTWLTLAGYGPECAIQWEEITMQDEVDHANARYLTARARQLEQKEEEL